VGDWLADTFPVARAFDEEVVRAGFRPAQMVLAAFLVTFGCVRAYTHMARRGVGPGDLSVGGTRIHHMVPPASSCCSAPGSRRSPSTPTRRGGCGG